MRTSSTHPSPTSYHPTHAVQGWAAPLPDAPELPLSALSGASGASGEPRHAHRAGIWPCLSSSEKARSSQVPHERPPVIPSTKSSDRPETKSGDSTLHKSRYSAAAPIASSNPTNPAATITSNHTNVLGDFCVRLTAGCLVLEPRGAAGDDACTAS